MQTQFTCPLAKIKKCQCLKSKFWLQLGKFPLQGSMTVGLFYISQRCMIPQANAAEFIFSWWAFRISDGVAELLILKWDRKDSNSTRWSHLKSGKKNPNDALTGFLLSALDWVGKEGAAGEPGQKSGRFGTVQGRADWEEGCCTGSLLLLHSKGPFCPWTLIWTLREEGGKGCDRAFAVPDGKTSQSGVRY